MQNLEWKKKIDQQYFVYKVKQEMKQNMIDKLLGITSNNKKRNSTAVQSLREPENGRKVSG